MRVLIIGTHRSGTTNLTRTLGKVCNLLYVGEPWNYGLWKKETYKYPEVLKRFTLVKTIIEHVPYNLQGISIFDFYADLVTYFDNVIILTRRDRVAMAESRAHAIARNQWQVKYSIDDPSKLYLDMDTVNERCDLIIKVAKSLSIPITWYEDLYSGDLDTIAKTIKPWGIDIDPKELMPYIDPKYKLRQKYKYKKPIL